MRATSMTIAAATLGLLAVSAASGQTPPPIARPGNDIGTGQSLPLSNNSSNISGTDTRSAIAPRLPAPPVSENAPPRAFLLAAKQALMAQRTGEAQEALERAEARALDGSVVPSQANAPSTDPFVIQVSKAIKTLATGDTAATIREIDAALAMRP